MLKKIALPTAIIYTILLTILSLITIEGVPSFGTEYDDKVYHIIAYTILTLIWYFALNIKSFNKTLFYLAVGCIAFGIVIEALQGKLTVYRVSDSMDVVANVVGVLLALTYIFIRNKNLS